MPAVTDRESGFIAVSLAVCMKHSTLGLFIQLANHEQYEDPSYIDALKYLQEDERVDILGLCNFDTENMLRVIDAGVNIYSNQIQVNDITLRFSFSI